jgi:hypothetical protein
MIEELKMILELEFIAMTLRCVSLHSNRMEIHAVANVLFSGIKMRKEVRNENFV